MDATIIKNYTHKHCRFKLRNGREVYGVIWEVNTSDEPISEHSEVGPEGLQLFFASIGDYERLQNNSGQPINVIHMHPEEIMHAERIAS